MACGLIDPDYPKAILVGVILTDLKFSWNLHDIQWE